MEPNPIQNDARRARRESRLGPDATCIHCGVTTPEALKPTQCRLVQSHHVAGEANDDKTVTPHCLNCHAIESEGQRARGVDLRRDTRRTVPETCRAVLQEVGLFLVALGQRLIVWADRLGMFIAALDGAYPQWRLLPEAQL